MKNILFKEKSLNEICSSINAGLVEIKDVSNLCIYSDRKPGFVVRIVECDLLEHIKHFTSVGGFGLIPKDEEFDVETNAFDYFVFSLAIDPNGAKILVNIPLFELATANKNLLSDGISENGVDNDDALSQAEWDMNKEIWNCVEF